MTTWTSSTTFADDVHGIMDVLTTVDLIERWSPVPFRVVEKQAERLRSGDQLVIEGSLVGRSLRFTVNVNEVSEARLMLRASGPFEIGVAYEIDPANHRIAGRIETSGSGLIVRVMLAATNAFLAAGALDHALTRIVAEAEVREPMLEPSEDLEVAPPLVGGAAPSYSCRPPSSSCSRTRPH